MKSKSIELDVDFIGGERLLTKEDEIAFSEFLKNEKLVQAKKDIRKISPNRRKKVSA